MMEMMSVFFSQPRIMAIFNDEEEQGNEKDGDKLDKSMEDGKLTLRSWRNIRLTHEE